MLPYPCSSCLGLPGLAWLGSAWLVSSAAATTTATTPEEADTTTAAARSAAAVVITASSGVVAVVVAAADETSQAEPRQLFSWRLVSGGVFPEGYTNGFRV